jgi:hypothetical protein
MEKNRDKEERYQEFKMNNNFMEFRVLPSSKSRRTREGYSQDISLFDNRMNESLASRKKINSVHKNLIKDVLP